MPIQTILLLALAGGMLLIVAAATHFSGQGSLNNIKSKTVGDGQHGTARWATKKEIEQTYRHIPFQPSQWRSGKELPQAQGLVLGCEGGSFPKKPRKNKKPPKSKSKKERHPLKAIVDTDDIHCLMIGASGVGKTAFFLYPNLEYACASGMSFLALDTKGDLARNYGTIASRYYGYQVAVIDLRNPTRSDGYNLLTLINHYMDICREDEKNLAARAKAEKYAKILSKTIVNPEGDASNYGQNAFFYDAAEGLLTAVILLLAAYLPPNDRDKREKRHIVSVFKLVQEGNEQSNIVYVKSNDDWTKLDNATIIMQDAPVLDIDKTDIALAVTYGREIFFYSFFQHLNHLIFIFIIPLVILASYGKV